MIAKNAFPSRGFLGNSFEIIRKRNMCINTCIIGKENPGKHWISGNSIDNTWIQVTVLKAFYTGKLCIRRITVTVLKSVWKNLANHYNIRRYKNGCPNMGNSFD